MYYDRINDGVTWPANQPLSEANLSKVEKGLATIDGVVAGLRAANNLSFDIDDDNDGVPDGWTWEALTGGSGGLVAGSAVHGSQCFRFTHPGGAGNGGGILDSQFIPISCYESRQFWFLSFILWSSVAGILNKVHIRYYDKDLVLLTDNVVYSSSVNPTTPMIFMCLFPAIPANTCFYRLHFVGGHDSDSTGGYTYIDGVEIIKTPFIGELPGVGTTCSIAQGTTQSTSYVDVTSAPVVVPGYYSYLNLPIRLTFDAQIRSSSTAHTATSRFRFGSIYSDEQSTTSDTYQTKTFVLDIPTPVEATHTLWMQLKINHGTGTAYGRKTTDTAVLINTTRGVIYL